METFVPPCRECQLRFCVAPTSRCVSSVKGSKANHPPLCVPTPLTRKTTKKVVRLACAYPVSPLIVRCELSNKCHLVEIRILKYIATKNYRRKKASRIEPHTAFHAIAQSNLCSMFATKINKLTFDAKFDVSCCRPRFACIQKHDCMGDPQGCSKNCGLFITLALFSPFHLCCRGTTKARKV